MRSMSARERRLVALLILTAIIAAAYFVVIGPIVTGFAARAERRGQLTLRYVHNQRAIGSIPRLRRQAELQRGVTDAFVADVGNAEAGREWLKDRLQRTVDRVGGEFREGSDAEGRPGWARARGAARMTLPQLTAALASLQNEPPWLIVETVSVTADDALVTGQSSSMEVEIEAAIPLRSAAVR